MEDPFGGRGFKGDVDESLGFTSLNTPFPQPCSTPVNFDPTVQLPDLRGTLRRKTREAQVDVVVDYSKRYTLGPL